MARLRLEADDAWLGPRFNHILSMLTWLIVLVLLWPLFWLIRVLLVTKVVLGLEIRRDRVLPLSVERIPAHLDEAARPLVHDLEGVGFQLLGGLHHV